MMNLVTIRAGLLVTALALAGCGGGGGGVNSAPMPTPTPTPTPTQVPSSYQPVAAAQSLEFDIAGGDIRIRWDNDSKAYEVMLPGKDWARLSPDGNNYAIADSNKLIEFFGNDKYHYTGIASTIDGNTNAYTTVAYGIATPLSGIPVTGSASYSAEIFGGAGNYSFASNGGHFDFDFAAGTLAGHFDPIAETPNEANSYELGRYDFVQTVFSGGQNFSGNLSHAGTIGGSFSGLSTGPQAQELMGRWELLFSDPVAPGTTLIGSGVFVGKETP